jgi:mannose-1-phosphate guanylyltransferase
LAKAGAEKVSRDYLIFGTLRIETEENSHGIALAQMFLLGGQAFPVMAPLRKTLCGIVLVIGDNRLGPAAKKLETLSLPTQYPVNGPRSLLEHTWDRVERLVARENLYTVIAENHLDQPYIKHQLSSRPPGTVIVQPSDKGMGPGLLLPLIYRRDRLQQATVAVFPADHFIREASWFMRYVDLAAEAVDQDPRRIVLLGIVPRRPETQYGYIVPENFSEPSSPAGCYRIAKFIEQPDTDEAAQVTRSGGLWNIRTMVFNSKTVLDLVRREVPELHAVFRYFGNAIGTVVEPDLLRAIYADLKPISFFRDVLQPSSERHFYSLHVIPVGNVRWSDRGIPDPTLNPFSKSGSMNRSHLKSNPAVLKNNSVRLKAVSDKSISSRHEK